LATRRQVAFATPVCGSDLFPVAKPAGLAIPDLALIGTRLWHNFPIMFSWSIVFVLCFALPVFASERDGCEATDYAPGSIPLLAAPVAGSRTLRSISRDELPSLRNIDGLGTSRGGWLKVRAGQTTGWVSARNLACRLSPESARAAIAGEAEKVIGLLRVRDVRSLAVSVHPVKGLRFSPYGIVDSRADQTIPASQLERAFASRTPRIWGADDASGKPIRLTCAAYLDRFVYDRDFAAARVTFNPSSDETRSVWEAYPSAILVEYAMPGNQQSPAAVLVLAFEQHNGKWYVSGIVHAGWTI
jgi:hypothetical protein